MAVLQALPSTTDPPKVDPRTRLHTTNPPPALQANFPRATGGLFFFFDSVTAAQPRGQTFEFSAHVLAITEGLVFLCRPDGTVVRCIPIGEVKLVQVDPLDNAIALLVPSQFDALIRVGGTRAAALKLVRVLARVFQLAKGGALPLDYLERGGLALTKSSTVLKLRPDASYQLSVQPVPSWDSAMSHSPRRPSHQYGPKPDLGIETALVNAPSRAGLDGGSWLAVSPNRVLVAGVFDGSVCALAGVKPGCLLLTWNDTLITTVEDVPSCFERTQANDIVELRCLAPIASSNSHVPIPSATPTPEYEERIYLVHMDAAVVFDPQQTPKRVPNMPTPQIGTRSKPVTRRRGASLLDIRSTGSSESMDGSVRSNSSQKSLSLSLQGRQATWPLPTSDPRTSLPIVDIPAKLMSNFHHLRGGMFHFFGTVECVRTVTPKIKTYVLMVTDEVVILTHTNGVHISRFFSVLDIAEMVVDQGAGQFGIRVPAEYDMLMKSTIPVTANLVHIISTIYKRLGNGQAVDVAYLDINRAKLLLNRPKDIRPLPIRPIPCVDFIFASLLRANRPEEPPPSPDTRLATELPSFTRASAETPHPALIIDDVSATPPNDDNYSVISETTSVGITVMVPSQTGESPRETEVRRETTPPPVSETSSQLAATHFSFAETVLTIPDSPQGRDLSGSAGGENVLEAIPQVPSSGTLSPSNTGLGTTRRDAAVLRGESLPARVHQPETAGSFGEEQSRANSIIGIQRVAALMRKIAELEAENESLSRQGTGFATKATTNLLQQRLAQREEENERLLSAVLETETEMGMLHREIQRLNQKSEREAEEIANLKAQVEKEKEQGHEILQLQVQSETLRQQLQERRDAELQWMGEREDLQSTLTALRQQLTLAQRPRSGPSTLPPEVIADVQRLRLQLDTQEKEYARQLRMYLQRQQHLLRQNSELTDQILQMRSSLDPKHDAAAVDAQQIQHELQSVQRRSDEDRERMEMLANENNELLVRIQDLEGALAGNDMTQLVADLQAEQDRLRLQVKVLRSELDLLTETLRLKDSQLALLTQQMEDKLRDDTSTASRPATADVSLQIFVIQHAKGCQTDPKTEIDLVTKLQSDLELSNASKRELQAELAAEKENVQLLTEDLERTREQLYLFSLRSLDDSPPTTTSIVRSPQRSGVDALLAPFHSPAKPPSFLPAPQSFNPAQSNTPSKAFVAELEAARQTLLFLRGVLQSQAPLARSAGRLGLRDRELEHVAAKADVLAQRLEAYLTVGGERSLQTVLRDVELLKSRAVQLGIAP